MKTRMYTLDVNKDGYVSREDYEVMSERLAECGGMTKDETESTYKQIADVLGFKPGVKISIKEAAQKATDAILSITQYEQKRALLYDEHNMLFDVIDTNNDGYISPEEFKVYYQIKAPETSDAAIIHSFNIIDSNKDGKICCQEFLNAAEDFMFGVEETEISKAFVGKLLD